MHERSKEAPQCCASSRTSPRLYASLTPKHDQSSSFSPFFTSEVSFERGRHNLSIHISLLDHSSLPLPSHHHAPSAYPSPFVCFVSSVFLANSSRCCVTSHQGKVSVRFWYQRPRGPRWKHKNESHASSSPPCPLRLPLSTRVLRQQCIPCQLHRWLVTCHAPHQGEVSVRF